MTSRDRKCVGGAWKWRPVVRILLSNFTVFTWSLKLKNWLRKCMYVTICDLHGPSRSPQVTGHGAKGKSIYEFLSMYNCNYRPIWHCYWDIDMQNFCNHGYIFERRFSPRSLKTYHFYELWRSYTVFPRKHQGSKMAPAYLFSFTLDLKSLAQKPTKKMRFS